MMVICNCLTCGVPMIVFRSHGARPLDEHIHAMRKAKELYGDKTAKHA